MQKYIMLIAGALILAAGIYLRDKKLENVTQERLLALGTYAGWVLMCIPASKLSTPLFANMSGNWPTTGVLVVQVILFIIGAELFLKKAFDASAAVKYQKPTYVKDNGKKNKKKNKNAAQAESKPEEKPKKAGGFKKLN